MSIRVLLFIPFFSIFMIWGYYQPKIIEKRMLHKNRRSLPRLIPIIIKIINYNQNSIYNFIPMKKFSESYLKKVVNHPVKSPSPDVKPPNRITATKSINSPSYSQKSFVHTGEQHRTPSKTWKTPKNAQSTSHKYFSNNRSTEDIKESHYHIARDNLNRTIGPEAIHQHSYCYDLSSEINAEIKKLLSLISSAGGVSQFHRHQRSQYSPEKDRVYNQIMTIQNENKKLMGLVQQLENRSAVVCPHANKNAELQHQISILRGQLAKTTSQCDNQYQMLYQANQALSSQLHSLQDRNSLLQKQTDSLRYMLRQKQEDQLRKQQETRRKSNQLSLKMIKQQYDQSIRTLGSNISAEVENINSEHQYRIRQMSSRVNLLQERIRGAEKQLKDKDIYSKGQSKDIQKYKSEIDTLRININNREKELRGLEDDNNRLQSELRVLRKKIGEIQEGQDQQTQAKVKKLMENYENSIAILKKQNQTLQSDKADANKEIKNLKSSQQSLIKNHKQQIQAISSQLYQLKLKSNTQADISYLENANIALKRTIDEMEGQIRILKGNERDLIGQLNQLKGETVSLHQYNFLKSKNGQLSRQLSQLHLQITKTQNENHQLLSQHQQLSQRLQQISNAYNRLNKTVNSQQLTNEAAIRQKDQKIHELEMTIHSITKLLEQMQEKVGFLQQNKNRLNLEFQNNQQLRGRIVQLESIISTSKIQRESEINQLKISLYNEIKEEMEKQVMMKVSSSSYNYGQQIKDELRGLKMLVDEGRFDRLEIELNQISELYNKQLLNSERNRLQIERLLRVQADSNNQRLQLQKLNLALQQKYKILESDNKLLEKELKQRREMYEQLINQKSILEKEIAQLKQGKLDKSSIEATRIKAKEIAMKIDRLLILEDERESNVVNYTTEYSVSEIKRKR